MSFVPSYDTRLRTEEYEEGRRGGRGGLGFLLIDVGFFFLLLFVVIFRYFYLIV